MAYGSGYVSVKEIFKAGLPMVIIGIILTALVMLAVLTFAPSLLGA